MENKEIDVNEEIDNLIENVNIDGDTNVEPTLIDKKNINHFLRRSQTPIWKAKAKNRVSSKIAKKSRKKNRKK